MKYLLSLILFTCASTASLAAEIKEKDINKNWFVAIGPVFSEALLGNNGTKYAVELGYRTGLSEKVTLSYFYNTSLNTSSLGSTPVSVFGAGFLFFFNQRTSDSSGFIRTDIGYGGGNRYSDASITAAVGIGIDFFRTKEFTFEAVFKHQRVATINVTSISGIPSVNQLMFGINF